MDSPNRCPSDDELRTYLVTERDEKNETDGFSQKDL